MTLKIEIATNTARIIKKAFKISNDLWICAMHLLSNTTNGVIRKIFRQAFFFYTEQKEDFHFLLLPIIDTQFAVQPFNFGKFYQKSPRRKQWQVRICNLVLYIQFSWYQSAP